MKKMKKLLSMLLTVIMVLAMAAPGFAGTITIENATVGQSYKIYKIFEATRGTGDAISYTATPKQKAWFEAQADNPFVFSRNAETSNYYVTVSENGNVKEFLQNLVGKNDKNEIIFKDGTSVTFEDETFTKLSDVIGNPTVGMAQQPKVEFSGLEYGYYLVTSSLGAIITLDSSNDNVKVIDKNQDGPSWGNDGYKGITKVDGQNVEMKASNPSDPSSTKIPNDKASANYGDVVEFEIKFHTTNYKGEDRIAHYYVDDTLAAGMEFNAAKESAVDADFVVKVGSQTLTKDTDYTVTFNNINNSFELVIDWYNEDATAHKYNSPNTITVTYTATVKDTAAIAGNGNANEANFTYTTLDKDGNEEQKPTTGSETKKATIYVYALGINKTDKTGNGLEGAEFALTDNAGTAINVHPIASESTDDVKVYAYGTVAGETASNVVVSPKNGYIVIKGIEAGTYKIKEVKAPNGYNLLASEESLVANLVEVEETETTQTVYYKANGEIIDKATYDELMGDASVEDKPVTKTVDTTYPMEAASFKTVVNFAGTMLPSTGGIGTTIFYAAGIILMAGAVFFVVRRKRA